MALRKTPASSGRRLPPGSPRSLKDFCRSLPGATEDVKWGEHHVFSVGGKMFAAFDLEGESRVGFKCDDEDFDRLTERDGIIPAPYAARFGWVRVTRRGVLKAAEARALLAKAHALVGAKLPRSVRKTLGL